jgi:HAE1 family hydrophobic/amphiphilic exporter-1
VAITGWLTWELGRRLETELLPEVHQGEFTIEVDLPVGTPLEETEAVLSPVEQSILADLGEIESVLVTFGYDVTNIKRSDEGEHTARFKIVLRPGLDPVATEARVLRALRAFRGHSDATVRRPTGPFQFPAARRRRTPERRSLLPRDLSARVEALLVDRPNWPTSRPPSGVAPGDPGHLPPRSPRPLWPQHRHRRLLVRDLVRGFRGHPLQSRGPPHPHRGPSRRDDRAQVDDVDASSSTQRRAPRPPARVADLAVGEGPSEIRRVDGQRVAAVQANVAVLCRAAVETIRSVLRQAIDWPAGMDSPSAGKARNGTAAAADLVLALALSLFLVYVIMAAQFESLLQPLIIMVSIRSPSLAAAGLALTGTAVSVMVFLASSSRRHRRQQRHRSRRLRQPVLRLGLTVTEAVALAGRVRLRPILLTTGTTVLGLLPMALGLGEGAEVRTPWP